VTTTQTPPPDAAAPPERRCPRCGHAMAPDQEWCLACGAAASTEVAEPRGWRVPIMLAGALALLAIIGVVLALVALSGGGEKLAQATPTPSPQAVPTTSPIPTASATVSPLPTESATPTDTAAPTETATPEASSTPEDNTDTGTGSTFSGWPGGTGWTVIVASKKSQSDAETVATEAQGKGLTVGILNSDDFSSLKPGYQVVFTEKFDSESAAEDSLSDVQNDYPDAYVRQVKE
jgi:predicted nucleic acid-binding Zn ribbon protein